MKININKYKEEGILNDEALKKDLLSSKKFQKLCKEANGKSRVRLFDEYSVIDGIRTIERYVEKHNIPKKYRKGIRVTYYERATNAYGNRFEYTTYSLTVTSTGVEVSNVNRTAGSVGGYSTYVWYGVRLPETTKEYLLKRYATELSTI